MDTCGVSAAPSARAQRGAGWIEPALGRVDLRRVGRKRVVLLAKLELAGGAQVERLDHELAADLREPRRERAVVVVADRKRSLERDRTGVELLDHAKDRDAGLRVAGHQGALDRCRAPPAGQQRGMDVEQLDPRQQRLADQLAEGADDSGLGLHGEDAVEFPRIAGVLGLEQLDPELARGISGRRRGEPAPAPPWPVDGGDDQRGPVLAFRKALEDGDREIRGAEEDRAHSGWLGVRVLVVLGARAVGGALAQGPQRLLALVAIRAIQDQDAVEVVDLVLEHPRLEAGRLDHQRLAAHVAATDAGVEGSLDVDADPGKAQASSSATASSSESHSISGLATAVGVASAPA